MPGLSQFVDKTVLVTGASRGLGRAIAVAFAAEGAFVIINYRHRNQEAADALDEVRRVGGDGELLPFDVSDADAVDAALGRRKDIEVLVNNAGVHRDNLVPLMTADEWKDVLSTNLSGVFYCASAVSAGMISQRRGSIVNIGSVAGLRASPGQASYSAAKGGVVSLTRTLAAELAPRGVRVNAVVPGLISTGMAARTDRAVVEATRERIPVGRLGDAEEVARVVVFVASPAASYLIGQSIVVDGGLSL